MRPGPARWVAALVFLLAWGLGLERASPTVALMDGVEFTLAGRTLGISHPSGYPVHALLIRGVDLLPLGDPGYRTALAATAPAALAAALAAFLMASFHGLGAGVGAGLLLAGLPSLGEAAATGEVYPLQTALLVGLLGLGLRVLHRPDDPRPLLAMGLLSGLAVAHHQAALLQLPLLLIPAWALRRRLRPGPVAAAFLASLLGLSAVLYLPVRSAQSPPMDRGSPRTSGALMEVLGKRAETSLGDLKTEPWRNARIHAPLLARELRDSLGLPGLALAALGAVALLRRRRAELLLLMLGSLPAGLVVTFAFYSRDPGIAYMVEPFYLPVLAAGALLAGAGIWSIRTALPPGLPRRLGIGLSLICCLAPPLTGLSRAEHRQDFLAYDWARNVLDSMPPGAIVLVAVDEYFPLAYCQLVEGLRPDLRIAHLRELLEEPDGWWRRVVTPRPEVVYRIGGSAPRDEADSVRRARRALAGYLEGPETRDRPLVMAHYVQQVLPAGWRVKVHGLAYPVVPPHPFDPAAELARSRRLWSRYRLRGLIPEAGAPPGPRLDFIRSYVVALNNLGAYATRLNRPDEARRAWNAALQLEPGNPTALRLLANQEKP